MPKVTKQKARKPYICGRCKEVIEVGSEYYKFSFFRSKPSIRCINHKPKNSELTQNEYLKECFLLQERTIKVDSIEDFESLKSELIEILTPLQEMLEEKMENLPENLRWAPVGELLEERSGIIDNALQELEELEIDEDETLEDALYGLEDAIQTIINDLG